MSRECREICAMRNDTPIVIDALLLRFPRGVVAGVEAAQLLDKSPTLADAPATALLDYAEAYDYLCTEYVTHDFSRIDLLKIASIVSQYPVEIIKRVARRCKAAGNYTIPYLATALENEGAGEIEALRRDQRINELISQSPPVELPAKRFPGELRARLHENKLNEEIERISRGD